MASWERWDGSEVTRWERWDSIEVTRWKVSGVIQAWMSQRFDIFVSDVNEWNKRDRMGSRCSCVVAGMEKLPLDLTQVVKNMVGFGSVWNL